MVAIFQRDARFPIRVTVQFYKATDNGVVTRGDMEGDSTDSDRVVYGDCEGHRQPRDRGPIAPLDRMGRRRKGKVQRRMCRSSGRSKKQQGKRANRCLSGR